MLNKHIKDTKKEFEKFFVVEGITLADGSLIRDYDKVRVGPSPNEVLAFIEKRERIAYRLGEDSAFDYATKKLEAIRSN